MNEEGKCEYVYLKDVKEEDYPHEHILNWQFIDVVEYVRIYFRPNKKIGLGFDFYAVEMTHDYEEGWSGCVVECIIRGWAAFDGVRHLYYGDEQTDNYGYHYYPNLQMIANTIKALSELEKRHCSDKWDNPEI